MPPRRLVATRTRRAVRASAGWRSRARSRATRCSSTGSARSGGRSAVECELDVVGSERRARRRLRATTLGGVDRGERHREHSGLHAADVEQVGDEGRERGEALVGGREQLRPVFRRRGAPPAARSPPTAADGRGERAAEVVADGRRAGRCAPGRSRPARRPRARSSVSSNVLERGFELRRRSRRGGGAPRHPARRRAARACRAARPRSDRQADHPAVGHRLAVGREDRAVRRDAGARPSCRTPLGRG